MDLNAANNRIKLLTEDLERNQKRADEVFFYSNFLRFYLPCRSYNSVHLTF
jgi:hypothetical protein